MLDGPVAEKYVPQIIDRSERHRQCDGLALLQRSVHGSSLDGCITLSHCGVRTLYLKLHGLLFLASIPEMGQARNKTRLFIYYYSIIHLYYYYYYYKYCCTRFIIVQMPAYLVSQQLLQLRVYYYTLTVQ